MIAGGAVSARKPGSRFAGSIGNREEDCHLLRAAVSSGLSLIDFGGGCWFPRIGVQRCCGWCG